MSDKRQQYETCIMINDTSHGSVATSFRCGGIFYYIVLLCHKFAAESALK